SPGRSTGMDVRSANRDPADFPRLEGGEVSAEVPLPPSFLPVGQTVGFEETVNAGKHTELSVVQMRLDASYGHMFTAHTQFHVQDKYRRNPTSEDRKVDADEAWIRFGDNPAFLDRPAGTSVFLQLGKM